MRELATAILLGLALVGAANHYRLSEKGQNVSALLLGAVAGVIVGLLAP